MSYYEAWLLQDGKRMSKPSLSVLLVCICMCVRVDSHAWALRIKDLTFCKALRPGPNSTQNTRAANWSSYPLEIDENMNCHMINKQQARHILFTLIYTRVRKCCLRSAHMEAQWYFSLCPLLQVTPISQMSFDTHIDTALTLPSWMLCLQFLSVISRWCSRCIWNLSLPRSLFTVSSVIFSVEMQTPGWIQTLTSECW